MLEQINNPDIGRHLGQKSEYIKTYTPSLLVREPRQTSRKILGIKDEALPFTGEDSWNCWEFSTLLQNGCPFCGILNIRYPANSTYIVESKSLKLYLNSFNMEKMSTNDFSEAAFRVENLIEKDLGNLLGTDKVLVNFIPLDRQTCKNTVVSSYQNLEHIIVMDKFSTDNYQEQPNLLEGFKSSEASLNVYKWKTSLLKSNCRHTKQPDFGDIYIYYRGSYVINPASVLKYLISFRDECHFHEMIVECVYKRLFDKFEPENLMVHGLYTRRGGIDISPLRYLKRDGVPWIAANENLWVSERQ